MARRKVMLTGGSAGSQGVDDSGFNYQDLIGQLNQPQQIPEVQAFGNFNAPPRQTNWLNQYQPTNYGFSDSGYGVGSQNTTDLLKTSGYNTYAQPEYQPQSDSGFMQGQGWENIAQGANMLTDYVSPPGSQINEPSLAAQLSSKTPLGSVINLGAEWLNTQGSKWSGGKNEYGYYENETAGAIYEGASTAFDPMQTGDRALKEGEYGDFLSMTTGINPSTIFTGSPGNPLAALFRQSARQYKADQKAGKERERQAERRKEIWEKKQNFMPEYTRLPYAVTAKYGGQVMQEGGSVPINVEDGETKISADRKSAKHYIGKDHKDGGIDEIAREEDYVLSTEYEEQGIDFGEWGKRVKEAKTQKQIDAIANQLGIT